MKGKEKTKEKISKGAASGIVALIFLIVGFQLALFVTKVLERSAQDQPLEYGQSAQDETSGEVAEQTEPADSQTVYRSMERPGRTALGGYPRPASSGSHRASSSARLALYRRPVESFPFDPNTVSIDDLERLGLSQRQAESIENYRNKGGRFRQKSDFQKMYVVSDTLYARLEPYIEIPKLELNSADSAALVSLKGIGPYYAKKIIEYRTALGGFRCKEQLLEIDGFDIDRYGPLSESITVDSSKVVKLNLWAESEERLAAHPYVGAKVARSIARFKSVYDTASWTIENLEIDNITLNQKLFLYLQVLKKEEKDASVQ